MVNDAGPASGPGLISQRFCWQKFSYSEKGQRKLLTQTSEGGWRVPHTLVLSYQDLTYFY